MRILKSRKELLRDREILAAAQIIKQGFENSLVDINLTHIIFLGIDYSMKNTINMKSYRHTRGNGRGYKLASG